MKNRLRKAKERARLTYDEVMTSFVEIERIINSQPLTYMGDNHDESFLTPYHLIYGYHINEKCYKYYARNEITSNQIREDFSSKLTNLNNYFRWIY